MPSDAQILNWIVQGGSFALVVAMIAFLGKVVFPRFVKLLDDQSAKADAQFARFELILKAQDERHERELAKRDETCSKLAGAVEKLADQIDRLCDRISHLEEKTDEHRPLTEEQAKRRQL